jgi:ferredoxin
VQGAPWLLPGGGGGLRCLLQPMFFTACTLLISMPPPPWAHADSSMELSNCIECGQCVSVCPVNALSERTEWRQVVDLLASKAKARPGGCAPNKRVVCLFVCFLIGGGGWWQPGPFKKEGGSSGCWRHASQPLSLHSRHTAHRLPLPCPSPF